MPARANQGTTRRLLNILGPFLGLLLVIGFFSAIPTVRPYFLTGANFKIILIQTVIVAIGALGMTLIIVSGGIDLSVGSVVALTSVIGATCLVKGHSLLLAIIETIAAGAGIGLLNGLAIGGLRMMPFIVTLGMMGIARGTAKWLSGSQVVNAPPEAVGKLMDMGNPTTFFPLPIGVGIAIGLAVVTALIMRGTVFGRYVFAIGANETAARLSGIRVPLQKVIIYTMAGVFFGISGVMQLSRLSEGDPTAAMGLELDIIAAVVIGGASLNGGVGSILGSMIGALLMAVLRNGSVLVGWPTYVQEIIIGAIIIFAVAVDKLRQRQGS